MKARKIGLLLLILGLGGSLETSWALRRHLSIGPTGCRVLGGRFLGPSFSFESEERREVPAGTAFTVENAFGGVSIRAGAPGEVRIKLRKVVFQPTETEARDAANRVRLEVRLEGSILRVSTNRAELEAGVLGSVGFETHLEFTLPPATAVKVQNDHGRVDVADVAAADVWNSYDTLRVERVAGPADLKARHGDVSAAKVAGALNLGARYGDAEVQDVQGLATLDVQHGNVSVARAAGLRIDMTYGTLRAQTIDGDLEVKGRHAEVQASEVKGKAVVETSYQNVRLSQIGGDVRVSTEHGEIDAKDVRGALSADATYDAVTLSRIAGPVQVKVAHGGLRAGGLEKGASVEVSGDEVLIDGFRGVVEVINRRGPVRLVPDGPLTDAVTATSVHGGIRLEVPPGSHFDFDASAGRGDIQLQIPDLTVTHSERTRTAGRVGGGGSLVRLSAERGDVSLEPRAAVASQR